MTMINGAFTIINGALVILYLALAAYSINEYYRKKGHWFWLAFALSSIIALIRR